ncbi:unnamed protein product [Lathyrus oleraceus]
MPNVKQSLVTSNPIIPYFSFPFLCFPPINLNPLISLSFPHISLSPKNLHRCPLSPSSLFLLFLLFSKECE